MSLSIEMLGLLLPALVAGIIVASTHVPLGQEVLKRGIIFIDLAIAQIAALGAVFAHAFFAAENELVSLFFALIFALVAGGLFARLEKISPKNLEAIIGSAFVISASLSILLLASDPHGGEHMQDMLAGQILWVGWLQLAATAAAYVILLGFWFGMQDKRTKIFYIVFPIAVTLSVKLVGVYLVFASLIIPALATTRLSGRSKLWFGYVVAVLAFITGLILSTVFDLPSGPVIVCCYPLFALAVSMLLAK